LYGVGKLRIFVLEICFIITHTTMYTLPRFKQNLHIDRNKVISYTTHVATIDEANKTLTVLGYWSVTTSKHINYVAREMGLTVVDPSKQKLTKYQKMVKQFEQINTVDELEELKIGNLTWEIGGRGGYLGFYNADIAKLLKLEPQMLPPKFGAYCNYLGGGIRGAICSSGYSDAIPADKAEVLDAISQACIRAYEDTENSMYMNDEEDEDGEINWEATATNAARKTGIESAY
jgi:hypothetical protein